MPAQTQELVRQTRTVTLRVGGGVGGDVTDPAASIDGGAQVAAVTRLSC